MSYNNVDSIDASTLPPREAAPSVYDDHRADSFNIGYSVGESRSRVVSVADNLRMLGVLDSSEAAQIDELLTRADEAEMIGTSTQARTERERSDIAAKVATGELEVTAIRVEAGKLPDPLHVLRISEAVYKKCISAAERIAYAHVGEAVGVLNAHFNELAAEAAKLATKLDGVTTADEAIARKVTDEWTAVASLQGTYSTLRGIVDLLREAEKLDKPRGGEHGLWWDFATAPFLGRGGFRKAHDSVNLDGGRAKFFQEMAAGPWVPTREEALAAAKVHDDAESAYQAGGRA
ncbi:hypothetical protein [Rhodococcus wratislaviensis]|uniref:hypothetical protein n=1 Tax=Rhodococcus wratislaviensis TaxID=44752 RepID=UPI003646820E